MKVLIRNSASIMDTALPQKLSFILDRNLAKANCTGNRVCTSSDIVVLGLGITFSFFYSKYFLKHAIDMKNQSFIFFTITYELNNFKC